MLRTRRLCPPDPLSLNRPKLSTVNQPPKRSETPVSKKRRKNRESELSFLADSLNTWSA